jgi:hypothetical protein
MKKLIVKIIHTINPRFFKRKPIGKLKSWGIYSAWNSEICFLDGSKYKR